MRCVSQPGFENRAFPGPMRLKRASERAWRHPAMPTSVCDTPGPSSRPRLCRLGVHHVSAGPVHFVEMPSAGCFLRTGLSLPARPPPPWSGHRILSAIGAACNVVSFGPERDAYCSLQRSANHMKNSVEETPALFFLRGVKTPCPVPPGARPRYLVSFILCCYTSWPPRAPPARTPPPPPTPPTTPKHPQPHPHPPTTPPTPIFVLPGPAGNCL